MSTYISETDVAACANKAITDANTLITDGETAVKDVTELVAECGGGNALAITLCVGTHAGQVATAVKDITKAVEDVPPAYTSLKADYQSCEGTLSADLKAVKDILATCV